MWLVRSPLKSQELFGQQTTAVTVQRGLVLHQQGGPDVGKWIHTKGDLVDR
jgi:hypothetical protein